MIVWSVASYKGGVGKTTTTASLAGFLQQENVRVLLIDTDPHASLTSYLGFDHLEIENNLFDLYTNPPKTKEQFMGIVTHTSFENLDLLASSMSLAAVDRALSGKSGVGKILKNSLKLVEDEYDIVLIDCPPILGALMVNALASSQKIIVPTQAEFLSVKSLVGMLKTFEIMQNADPSFLKNYTLVPTMFDKRTKASGLCLEELNRDYPNNLWQGMIPIDNQFRLASEQGLPINLFNAKARGALAYQKLLEDLIQDELTSKNEGLTPALAAIVKFNHKSE